MLTIFMNQPSNNPTLRSPGRRAFTIIELLTVVSCITVLMAITVPIAHGLRNRALKVRAKAQFGQWATAMEQFRVEYGGYPVLSGSGTVGSSTQDNLIQSDRFAVALTGRHMDGTDADLRGPSVQAAKKDGNTKLLSFYNLSPDLVDTSITPPVLMDSFGNKDIAVLYDNNLDGIINISDQNKTPPVKGVNGGVFTPNPTADINLTQSQGIRAGVIFYSAGVGNSSDDPVDSDQAVFSWK